MKAVILAAGKSTRTYPLTKSMPKPLLKAAGKSILEHNLTELSGIVDEAIIIVGYKKEMIIDVFKDSYAGIKITYLEQSNQNGTGGAVILAKELLRDEQKFIVMNGDDFFTGEDIKKCLQHDTAILVKEVLDLSRFGEVITKDNLVMNLKEKPAKNEGMANTGLYVFTPKIFEFKLQKSKRGEYEITDFITHLIKSKHEVKYEKASFWTAVTYPWNLLEANEYFLNNLEDKRLGEIENGATIKGSVYVGKNTLIKAGAYIEGPVYIGENCVIGPNCFVRNYTTIGNNSKIGNAVEVKNTIIGENTSIGHLSYVGDSVIGNFVNFGAGTITANLRHDDENVKSLVKDKLVDTGRRKLGCIIGDGVHTGINTSIYPGRKIDFKKTTHPGEIVKKDVV